MENETCQMENNPAIEEHLRRLESVRLNQMANEKCQMENGKSALFMLRIHTR
jgi:hypothetical protein